MKIRSFPSVALRGLRLALLGAAIVGAGIAQADEAAIRKTLAERMPNLPRIDEITKTPVPGLYEVRFGSDIVYVDETGNYLFDGNLVETRTRTDLTKARIDKLTAIEFDALPFKDAIVMKQGTGLRRMAVFADPNCGYCKQLERDLVGLKDVTIYTFVIPILGPDSNAKARDIVCAKDAMKTWRAWMIDGVKPGRAAESCDSAAIARNLELGRKHKVNGTPAIVFEDGSRSPGVMPAERIDKQLNATRKS